MSSQELRKPDEGLSQEIQAVPVKRSEVAPLNYEAALASYSPEEQKEIMVLAESIDVKEADKVMNYGAEPLKQTFTQCGDFLKSERGPKADQEVLDMVITLAKKAKDSYEDFNLIIKEPSFLQKIFFKLATSEKESHMDKIQRGAGQQPDHRLQKSQQASGDRRNGSAHGAGAVCALRHRQVFHEADRADLLG